MLQCLNVHFLLALPQSSMTNQCFLVGFFGSLFPGLHMSYDRWMKMRNHISPLCIMTLVISQSNHEQAALLHFDTKPCTLILYLINWLCLLTNHCWWPHQPEVNKHISLMHTPHLRCVYTFELIPQLIGSLWGVVKSDFQLDKLLPVLQGWIH